MVKINYINRAAAAEECRKSPHVVIWIPVLVSLGARLEYRRGTGILTMQASI